MSKEEKKNNDNSSTSSNKLTGSNSANKEVKEARVVSISKISDLQKKKLINEIVRSTKSY